MTAPVGLIVSRETTKIADMAIPTASTPAATRAIVAVNAPHKDRRGLSCAELRSRTMPSAESLAEAMAPSEVVGPVRSGIGFIGDDRDIRTVERPWLFCGLRVRWFGW